MGMRILKVRFAPLFVIILFSLLGCDQMDTVLSATGSYQVKSLINNTPLNENSFITASCEIQPHFTNFDLNDPDITGLVVFLRNAQGEIPGSRIYYILESHLEEYPEQEHAAQDQSSDENEGDGEEAEEKTGQTNVIVVSRLDRDMPFFPMPQGLPAGHYSLVYQVMGGDRVLFQAEDAFFFLGNANFAFHDIQMYLPNAAATSRLVPTGAKIMLEARMTFDSTLNPYIVWFNGRRIISEGYFSDGAAKILWRAPEQNTFLSLRAEVFPVRAGHGLAGISREISLPVSTRVADAGIISARSPGLLHWYFFEGDLRDSKSPLSDAHSLRPAGANLPNWMPAGGSYGLATGPKNVFMLPKIAFSRHGAEDGQFLLRFRPLAEGNIFTVQFEPGENYEYAEMNLSFESERLFLHLRSSSGVAAKSIAVARNVFVTAAIDFSMLSDRVEAALNLLESPILPSGTGLYSYADSEDEDDSYYQEQDAVSIALRAPLNGEFKVLLGAAVEQEFTAVQANQNELFTAIWDEFALFYKLP